MVEMGWPRPLQPVTGPFAADLIDGAADGMGAFGPATRDLVKAGWVQPDLIIGMTLFLLARQPRREQPDGENAGDRAESKKATPIDGGVWVREQFTIHRPLPRSDAFTITGASTGRYVHKGRLYGTNQSVSHTGDGELVATNLTTGLISYKVDAGRQDQVEGLPLDQTPAPDPDWTAAASNPHSAAIRAAAAGYEFNVPSGESRMAITPAMLTARAGAKPDNPIHNDPEAARRAGLARPIAGGSHVAAFALEPLLAVWGPHALSHGAKFDLRWRAPTEADVPIRPSASIIAVEADRVEVELAVTIEDGPVAMVGTVIVPLAT